MSTDCHSLSVEELTNKAIASFRQQFGTGPASAAFAPGRVNVIGEHTDYNDGFVLPIALGMGTVAVGSISRSTISDRTEDELTVKLATAETHVDAPFSVTLTYKHQPLLPGQWSPNFQPQPSPRWANYILGSVAALSDDLLQSCISQHESSAVSVNGSRSTAVSLQLNILVASSIPIGAGLSSSAAVEVSVYYLMHSLLEKPLPSVDKAALACQKVEHKFAGVPCGIMDQMISAGGRSSSAMLIDCRDLSFLNVPLPSSNYAVFIIADTGVRHTLATSEYSIRRQQCQAASKRLQVQSLRDISTWPPKNLPANVNYDDDVEMRRARHVVTEDERCNLAANAMATACADANDEAKVKKALGELGRLMTASHISLAGDYAVSCPELDRLVEVANATAGVYGSRMTGGGFGGSTVTLAEPSCVPTLLAALEKAGAVRTFVVTAADGARVLLNNSAAGPTA